MSFLLSLVVDGMLSGALYALVAVALVVTYKVSRSLNLALGEWVTLGALLAAASLASGLVGGLVGALGLGLPAAIVLALAGMAGLAALFSRWVLTPLIGRPAITIILLTLGLGALLRGAGDILFRGVPRNLALPLPGGAIDLGLVVIPSARLSAAVVSVLVIAAVAWLYRKSRFGIALRAIADDQQAAMVAGIAIGRHLALAWGLAGLIATLAGLLWLSLTSGGFGLTLLGLKVLPVVVLGGLTSIAGTLAGAMIIGILEGLGSGYLDPLLGPGLGGLLPNVALLAMLFARPQGLFGKPEPTRV